MIASAGFWQTSFHLYADVVKPTFPIGSIKSSVYADEIKPPAADHFTSSGRYFTGSVPWLNTASWYLPRSNASPWCRCTACRSR